MKKYLNILQDSCTKKQWSKAVELSRKCEVYTAETDSYIPLVFSELKSYLS